MYANNDVHKYIDLDDELCFYSAKTWQVQISEGMSIFLKRWALGAWGDLLITWSRCDNDSLRSIAADNDIWFKKWQTSWQSQYCSKFILWDKHQQKEHLWSELGIFVESRIEDKKGFTESDRGHQRVGFDPLVQQQIYTLLRCYIHRRSTD